MNQRETADGKTLRSLGTRIPDQLSEDVAFAKAKLSESVGGSLSEFVRERLGWSQEELVSALSEEQVEAVALIIYNFEARRQAAIVGDQTGVGKGRVAAALIRYGTLHGQRPVFVTDKANLFTDIYRDITDIGCGDLRPFIISSNNSKAHVRRMNDEYGHAIFRPLPAEQQEAIFNTGALPADCDYVMTTYSQFSHRVVVKSASSALGRGKKELDSGDEDKVVDSLKQAYLKKIVKGNILILDESHSAAGKSNRGEFFREVEMCAENVCFLSATYSKRPENMPLYVPRTCVSEAGLSMEELDKAISQGGEAMQEVISSCIVRNGQMIRREYDNSGVRVNYLTLNAKCREMAAKEMNLDVEDLEEEQVRLSDMIMPLVERIVEVDRMIGLEYVGIAERKGLKRSAEVNFTRGAYMMRVFNIVNLVLFSLKAKAIARHAIRRLKEGKAVVVAFSNTMEAVLNALLDNGVSVGDVVDDEFAYALRKDLYSLLRFNEKEGDEFVEEHPIRLEDLSELTRRMFLDVSKEISELRTGLSLSPIDTIARTIEYAGFTTAEVTGRRLCVQIDDEGNSVLSSRQRENINTSFARFQNNKVDALLVNRSGATGASVHAVETEVVGIGHVRQRLMIIAQMELDVNQEVQKRGRVNRTGQIMLPEYDYLSTAIPAEQRLMLMMQKKLLSLDANTSANKRESVDIINIPDMMNRFGDQACVEYFRDRPEMLSRLGIDLNVKNDCTFRKVSGRIAILPVAMQVEFYEVVTEAFDELVELAKSEGRYDLDVEELPLNAKLLKRMAILPPEEDGRTVFSDGIFLDTYECDNLNKPYTVKELQEQIRANIEEYCEGDVEPEESGKIIYRYILSLQRKYKKHVEDKLWANFYAKIGGLLGKESLTVEERNYYSRAVLNQLAYNEARGLDKRTFDAIKSMMAALERQDGLYEKYKGRMVFVREFWGGRPLVTLSGSHAVCLGVKMHPTHDDGIAHYRPSDVNIIIALPDSKRSLKYNLADAGYNVISEMNYKSYRSEYYGDPKGLLEDWPKITSEYVADRRIRHIITGNILKGYKLVRTYHGRLVKFSLADSEDGLNGILLPDRMNLDEIPVACKTYSLDGGNAKLLQLLKNILVTHARVRLHAKGCLMQMGVIDYQQYNGTITERKYQLWIDVLGDYAAEWPKLKDEIGEHEYVQAHLAEPLYRGGPLVLKDYDMSKVCDVLSDYGVKIELTAEQATAAGLFVGIDKLKDGWWPKLPLHCSRVSHKVEGNVEAK